MKISKQNFEWWRYLTLIISGAINAFGVVAFLLPSSILDSGISGVSLLIANLTPYSISIFIFTINIPFFLLGFRRLGKKFIVYSVLAIASYSIFSFVFDSIVNIDEIMFRAVKSDMFLCAIFGGLISGIGSGLTIKMGGAIDGIEVMAVSFAKRLSLTVGQFVMIFNALVYIIACFLLKNFSVGLYSIVTYGIGLKAVDFIVDGFDKGKCCIVITDKADIISDAISQQMGRGITLINSKGYYSGDDKTMIYCVVNRFEISKLKSLIQENDPSAFVTISEISEVLGDSINLKRRKHVNVETITLPEDATFAAPPLIDGDIDNAADNTNTELSGAPDAADSGNGDSDRTDYNI